MSVATMSDDKTWLRYVPYWTIDAEGWAPVVVCLDMIELGERVAMGPWQ